MFNVKVLVLKLFLIYLRVFNELVQKIKIDGEMFDLNQTKNL
jgi:hypothetical protein